MQRLWSSRMRFLVVTIVSLLAVASTVKLGFWQLSRAKEKIAIQAVYEKRAKMPVVTTQVLSAMDWIDTRSDALSAWLYRSATLEGVWLEEKTVYLDNRQMHGKTGFFVVTPMRLENSSAVILVQRGWVPRNFLDRNQLIPVKTTSKPVRVSGYLAASPARLFEFAAPTKEAGISRIRQNLNIEEYRYEAGLALLPFSLVQNVVDKEIQIFGDISIKDDGLLRDWPSLTMNVDRNYGYAFQWFGLSGLIVLLYVWFQFIRRSSPTNGG
jgi:surfeit locus 1 family protein